VERRNRAVEKLVTPQPGFWAGKRVLVLGHTGFKGAWLSLWLRRLNANVFGLSLPPADQPNLFTAAALGSAIDSGFADISDLDALTRAMRRIQPQLVFHLAAQSLVRLSYCEPVRTFATNVMGTVHVLAAVQATVSVRCLVVVTSDKCYQNRERLRPYREEEPLGGDDPYSGSKACAELVTAAWRRSFCPPDGTRRLGIASARAGNVYGGGDWALDRLVPDCMRALGGGRPVGIRNPRSIRPWQHVLDPLCGYMILAERLWDEPEAYGEAWNFGPPGDEVRPVGWIASRIAELWGDGARWETTPSDSRHEAALLKVDAAKARARLGWSQRLPLETGLDWTVEWYRAFGQGRAARELTEEQIDRFAPPLARMPRAEPVARVEND
jgi:CDP-glucose 4,6-dehydratase